ncbi:lipoyl(octanoyl) transferase LipB [Candidatus Bipolaricaulota bacterium]
MSLNSVIRHLSLEKADYNETLALQRALHAKRCVNAGDDLVISVEHNPVFTIGRSGSRANVLVSDDVLGDHGIQVYEVERGGDITYHGPGQLVIYPILDLRGFGKDIHRFVWLLEEAIIRTLSELAIRSDRRSGFPGVWVDERKVASVGVYVKNWVSMHGLALNIDVEQEHFRMIRPCGLSVETVSVNDLVASAVALSDVRSLLLCELGSLLERELVESELEELI